MSTQMQRFLGIPFFFALVGILFSVWNLWGDSSVLCLTEGCNLFQDFTLAGISIWWLGLVGFALLLLASIPGFAGVGLFMAGAGLALDSFLLLIMLLTAPCFNCLLIGGLLALSFMAYRTAWREGQRIRGPFGFSPALSLWTLLFVLNIGVLANSETGPWALPQTGLAAQGRFEPSAAHVQVYFSPSCPACLELVKAAGQGGAGGDPGQGQAFPDIAWFPVAEEGRDLWVIASLKRRMGGGEDLASALGEALAETPASPDVRESLMPGMLWLQYRLWRNKAHVFKSGAHVLPFVEFRGAPSSLLGAGGSPAMPDRPSAASAQVSAQDAQLPFLSVSGFCGDSEEPCDSGPQEPGPSLREIMDARGN